MNTRSLSIKQLPTPIAYGAADFSAEDRFNSVTNQERALMLHQVEAGKTLIDIGCGNGELVTKLRSRGVIAVGFDLPKENGNKQKPDITGDISTGLTFRNNTFDYATNYFGGLTYPLYFEAAWRDQDLTKQSVLFQLGTITEALRVAQEVRIYPWSLAPFGSQLGVLAHYVGEVDNSPFTSKVNFLTIDYNKLFAEMDLDVKIVAPYKNSPLNIIRSYLFPETLILTKRGNEFNLGPIEELKTRIPSENQLILSERTTDYGIGHLIGEVVANQRNCNNLMREYESIFETGDPRLNIISFLTSTGDKTDYSRLSLEKLVSILDNKFADACIDGVNRVEESVGILKNDINKRHLLINS